MVRSVAAAKALSPERAETILDSAERRRVLVFGDMILDRYIWGTTNRVSQEAPVLVLDVNREEGRAGGAANVARNIAALGGSVEAVGVIGMDGAGKELRGLLREQDVSTEGLLCDRSGRVTTVKTRVFAHDQQTLRFDREVRDSVGPETERKLTEHIRHRAEEVDSVVIGDYGKGAVTQRLLDGIRMTCGGIGIQVSMDPKPVHSLDLTGLALLTPNRGEAFEMAGVKDGQRKDDPRDDTGLMLVVERLMDSLKPGILLITLGEQGMLLCQPGEEATHVPTAARAVYDVSGAGDTVIAAFALARMGEATALEAAVLANHAAGIVIGKVGTAVASRKELLDSLARQ